MSFSAEGDKTDDPVVWPLMDDRKLSEILVECDDDLRAMERAGKDVFIAWIRGPVGNSSTS